MQWIRLHVIQAGRFRLYHGSERAGELEEMVVVARHAKVAGSILSRGSKILSLSRSYSLQGGR